MGPKVTVIVVHFGSYDDLRDCLRTVVQHTKDTEVIVVDNDELPSEFSRSFPEVKLIRSAGNVGFGSACNQGAELARGSVLVFMNNDVMASNGWLEPLLRTISDDSVGCVCPLVVFRDHPDVVNAAGGDADFMALAWRRNIGKSKRNNLGGPFFWATGDCLAVRKDVFEQVGGFDESLFLFLEDVDLSWRVRLAGWKLALASESVVLHKWMASTSKLAPSDIQYLFSRNRLRLILKNYSGIRLLRILPIYMGLQLGLVMWIFARRQSLELKAVVAAWLWNFRNLANTIRKREYTQSFRKATDKEIMRLMYRGIAGIHLALGTMKHPVFESYFGRTRRDHSG